MSSKPPVPPEKKSPLQEVVNAPELVTAFGRTYMISKFTLGPLCQAAEYVGPMGFLLKRLMSLPKDKDGKVTATPEDMLEFAVTAISISGTSVFGLISVATKEPPEWLELQDPMDGLRIFAKVVEKNLDFFSQSNLDQFKGIFGKLMQQIPTLGGEQSTS